VKLLVTIGTTHWDELMRAVDELQLPGVEAALQIGDGNYLPSRYPYFRFDEDIDKRYRWADAIVSHAGAGSTFRILELAKPLLLVPNLTRVDDHQKDLASYMERNHHALVAWSLADLPAMLHRLLAGEYELKPYRAERFFAHAELARLIEDSRR
jgi:beta-1,4-N-acetylglucosaminyltransferase